MKKTNCLLLLSTLFWLFACQKNELAEEPAYHKPESKVDALYKRSSTPLKGTLLYAADPGIDLICDCAFLPAPDRGQGNMTHMGKVTSESIACVDNFFTLPDGTITGFSIASQCVLITAANGDEITFEPDPFEMHFDPECHCIRGSSIYHIAGGTGRFEDAVGAVNVRTSNDLAGTIITEWDGEIDY